MGTRHSGLEVQDTRRHGVIMDLFWEIFWTVVGIAIVFGVFCLIGLAWYCVEQSFEDIHNN